MKKQLVLEDLPTFHNGTKVEIGRVNLFYGKNGSGKTTICRYIEDRPEKLCENQEELIVFNKNFKDSRIIDGMKGIYTFNALNSEIISKISSNKVQIDLHSDDIEKLKEKIENTDEQIDRYSEEFNNYIWDLKKEIVKQYSKVELFKGYNGSKAKFAEELLKVYSELSKEEYDSSRVDQYYDLIASDESTLFNEYQQLDVMECSSIEGFELLSKPITSHSDSDLEKFYRKLDNLNWVDTGRMFIQEDNKCPFCNKDLDKCFIDHLKKVFDDVYEEDIKVLSTFIDEYDRYLDAILSQINNIIVKTYDSFDYTSLNSSAFKIISIISDNQRLMEEKKNNPALSIVLDEIIDCVNYFNNELTKINKMIVQHNEDVVRKKEIPEILDKLFWIKLSKDSCHLCDRYKKHMGGLKKQRDEHEQTIKDLNVKVFELKFSAIFKQWPYDIDLLQKTPGPYLHQ